VDSRRARDYEGSTDRRTEVIDYEKTLDNLMRSAFMAGADYGEIGLDAFTRTLKGGDSDECEESEEDREAFKAWRSFYVGLPESTDGVGSESAMGDQQTQNAERGQALPRSTSPDEICPCSTPAFTHRYRWHDPSYEHHSEDAGEFIASSGYPSPDKSVEETPTGRYERIIGDAGPAMNDLDL
jgi:hypothetical protein